MNLDMPDDPLTAVRYEEQPSVLVIADTEAGLGQGRHAAALAGCRLLGEVMLPDALDRLRRQVAADAVYAHLMLDGDGADPLLRALDGALSAGASGW